MTTTRTVRTFALVGVAAAGLAALKALHLGDDVVRLVMLETPAYALPADPNEPDDSGDHAHHGDPGTGPAADHPATDDDHSGHGDDTHRGRETEQCEAATIANRAGLTHAEISVLRSLSDRRREIDAREAELATQATLLEAAEARIEGRMAELRAMRDEIEGLLGELDTVEETDMSRLVALYERMDPRAAAPILSNLEDGILFAVTSRMDETRLAPLLAAMTPEEAVRVTMLLATGQERAAAAEARLAAALGVEP